MSLPVSMGQDGGPAGGEGHPLASDAASAKFWVLAMGR